MAHEVQPTHVPHDQLRTEAPGRREQTDKYVSAFVSSSADVDMTFRTPILPKSSDHFKVGIDELTVNLGNLSMLEYGTNDVIFRVLRRGNNTNETHGNFHMIDGPVGDLTYWRDAFEFKVDRAYLTILEILERFTQIATAVSTFIRSEGLVQPGGAAANLWTAVQAAGAEHGFFKIMLSPNGNLEFSGTRLFWANFTIEVPQEKYRVIIFKKPALRHISMHPGSGNLIAAPYTVNPAGDVTAANLAPVWDGNLGNEEDTNAIKYVSAGNLLNTLDRRVTLEVGCSLPIKNSPLVDHGVEAPDFVLGRYMFHQPYSMSDDTDKYQANITVPHLGTITVQGPRDRVVFHHLQPQQKIQVLRLKLWARVRTYDERSKTWGMKTIVCPVEDTDYWHIRLHFIQK